MEKSHASITEKTGLKPIPTFEQLMNEYLSMGPKIPENTRQATLIWNSMAFSQFVGYAQETEDNMKTAMAMQERDEFIRKLAMRHGFHPHDILNAADVLDGDVDHRPKPSNEEDDGSDSDVDMDDMGDMNGRGGPPPQRYHIGTPRVPPIPKFSTATHRTPEYDWTSTRYNRPPPGPPPAPQAPVFTTSHPPKMGFYKPPPKGGFHHPGQATSSSSHPHHPPPPPPPSAQVPVSGNIGQAPPPPPPPPHVEPAVLSHILIQSQNLAQQQQTAFDQAQHLIGQVRLESARRHEEERMARLFDEQTRQNAFSKAFAALSGIGAQQKAETDARIAQVAGLAAQLGQQATQMAQQTHAHATHATQQTAAQVAHLTQAHAESTQQMAQSAQQAEAKYERLMQELTEARRQLDMMAQNQGVHGAHSEMEALRKHIAELERRNAAFATRVEQTIGQSVSTFSQGMQDMVQAHRQAIDGIVSALQRLSNIPSQAKPAEVSRILNYYNAPFSAQIHSIALAVAQRREGPERLVNLLALEGPASTGSGTSVESAEAPMLATGPAGESGPTKEASAQPMTLMGPDGLPVIDITGTVLPHAIEPPKPPLWVSRPRNRQRLGLKYHKKRAKLTVAVLQGKKTADEAREQLRRLRQRELHVPNQEPDQEPDQEPEPRGRSQLPIRKTIDKRAEAEEREYKKSRPMRGPGNAAPSSSVEIDIRNKRMSEEDEQRPGKRQKATPTQAPVIRQRPVRPTQAPVQPSRAPRPRPSQRPVRPTQAPGSIFKGVKRPPEAAASSSSLVRPSAKPKARPSQRAPRPSQAP
jgi:hypothetical protein